ncbi:P-loop containing nucleoside triphosphate hydrolase protein [Piromyces finnis]|uniref:RNA helicase n=1 Tax=Piromyces finnis TaxID=1754191 RepID=A0A1Y1UQP1_9FUNG|nr:P-loop containing nucleoside triphosphate hydrolase protein [Piromyces finnis]|eukprot:ORX39465.1 P-loop containing nucleoside triphosphate hydrolase protein [Piromyces finnis]
MEKKKKEQEIKSHDSIGEVKASNILKLMSLNCHEPEKIPGFRLNNVAEKKLLDFALANRIEDNKVPLKKLTEQDLYSNYLVLMKLGFKDEHIQEAFLKAESFSINSLLEWLYLSLEAEDIPLNIRGEIKMLNDTNVNISLTANEKKPIKSKQNNKEQNENKKLNTPPKVQKVEAPKVDSKPVKKVPERNVIDSKLKNSILSNYMYYSDEEEEEELIDVNESFAKLQLQIDKQTKLIKKAKSNNNHGLAANLQNSNRGIRKEMEKLKESSTFDISKVNAIVREISRAAREKRETKEKNDEKENELEEQVEENDDKNEENKEDEDEDEMGIFGMFDAEEDNNQSSSQNSVVKMELLDVKYKSWSGKSPYKLAEDTLKKRVGSKAKLIFEIVRKTPGYQGRIKVQCQDQSLNKKVIEDDYYYFETIEESKNYLGVKLLYVLNPNLNFNTLVPIPFRDFIGKWESKKDEGKMKVIEDRLEFIKIVMEARKLEETKPIEEKKEENQEVEEEEELSSDDDNDKSKRNGKGGNKYLPNTNKNSSYKAMLKKRETLPIYKHRKEILDLIENNQVVLIAGETGSGKSTQIPQFIMEYMEENNQLDKCNVICTQPRRISAISIAQRVSIERGEKPNSVGKSRSAVGYQVRLNSKISRSTKLLFCTVGILLRRFENKESMADISHIIVDEVHERSMDCDFLLVVLRQLIETNPNIKIILMSASVNALRFSQYFNNCPVINIEGRTFPVESFYLEDIIELTGYSIEEDSEYAKKNSVKFNDIGKVKVTGQAGSSKDVRLAWEESALKREHDYLLDENQEYEYSLTTVKALDYLDPKLIPYDLIETLVEYIDHLEDEGAILIFLPGIMNITIMHDLLTAKKQYTEGKWNIIPLHSSLEQSNSDGAKTLFNPSPKGVRKIVLSTNIAETGVTIPDVVYVIDSGKVKETRYDDKKKLTLFKEVYISQANAKQRKGRAGRIRPGKCFHLYTKKRHDEMFLHYSKPEILRCHLEEPIMRILLCDFGHPYKFLSQALDPPSDESIIMSLKSLYDADAIEEVVDEDSSNSNLSQNIFNPITTGDAVLQKRKIKNDDYDIIINTNIRLTTLGHHLARLPVGNVHLGKLIIWGIILNCFEPCLLLASYLSLGGKDIFYTPINREAEVNAKKSTFFSVESDFHTVLNVYKKWEAERERKGNKTHYYCKRNYLSQNTLLQIMEIKNQLKQLVYDQGLIEENDESNTNRNKYSNSIAVINTALAIAFHPNIARLDRSVLKRNDINTIYKYELIEPSINPKSSRVVHIHPSSFLANHLGRIYEETATTETKRWFIYYNKRESTRVFISVVGMINPLTLILCSKKLEIEYNQKMILLDNNIFMKCPPKTAVMLKILKKRMNFFIQQNIASTNFASDEGEKCVDLIYDLLSLWDRENLKDYEYLEFK